MIPITASTLIPVTVPISDSSSVMSAACVAFVVSTIIVVDADISVVDAGISVVEPIS